jgi:hypothetical protein
VIASNSGGLTIGDVARHSTRALPALPNANLSYGSPGSSARPGSAKPGSATLRSASETFSSEVVASLSGRFPVPPRGMTPVRHVPSTPVL